MNKLSVLSLIAAVAFSGSVTALAPGIEATIKKQMQISRADLIIESVTQSPMKGVYEATLAAGGPVFYVSADGKHMMVGDLYEVAPGGLVNLTEQAQDIERKNLLASISKDDMIVFSPKGQVKASVTVFTDVDCGYCQKLHEEVPALNAKGIEVRYLAYPRAGIGSPSYNKIVSAWCANDQQDALTKLKRRQPIPTNICAGNPVAAQFALGGKMGVRGTPALVLESGRLLPGYMPADRLAAELGVN
ncbi:MAG: thiol:disulfide interchange protein DsbC [Chitinophagales bacterium]|jgi:thiol:disulfide interchange protein DsbC|tara:strand:- start:1230 stop:1967 length:738 start_codon:yes stop_codon:yes gene_type:complete